MPKNPKKEKKPNFFELYFNSWVAELEAIDYVVTSVEQPEAFVIYPPLAVPYVEVMKTKEKISSVNILPDMQYTADNKIVFHKDSPMAQFLFDLTEPIGNKDPREALFFYTKKTRSGHPIIWVDVKPSGKAMRFSGAMGSARDFPIKQRLLYELHGVYINKVVPFDQPTCLFAKTFAPYDYYMTEKKTGVRSMPKKPKTKIPLYSIIQINEYRARLENRQEQVSTRRPRTRR